MHWNHRVFKETTTDPLASENGDWFTIREVYYNDDESIMAYGNPEVVESDSIEGLRQILTWMLNSLDTPILSEDTVVLVDEFDTNTDDTTEEDDWEGEDWDYDI